jgi:hypothetical protein
VRRIRRLLKNCPELKTASAALERDNWGGAGVHSNRCVDSLEDLLGDFELGAVFLFSVDRLKTVMATVLLAMWMPATSLCLLENAGLVAKNDDCPASQSSEASPCCALASAAYKIDENRQVAVHPHADVMSVLVDLALLIWPPNQFSRGESGVSPPELSKSWQFSFRAALTPRAPSSAS